MSAYYVIGSDTKIKNIKKLNLGFEETKSLNKYIKNYTFNKKFYYISDPIVNELGYDITNFEDFYKDENKKKFIKFIDFIKSNACGQIEFYKFWSIFKASEDGTNDIYQEISYNLNNFQFPDNKFEFEFNTKYIFNTSQS